MPRGSDFTARWAEGAWAEKQIVQAFHQSSTHVAVQYGITSGEAFRSSRDMVARDLPVQGSHGKRPDILIFDRSHISDEEIGRAVDIRLLGDAACDDLVHKAVFAIESEFSPYAYHHRLAQYGEELSFTVKEEDLLPILTWSRHFKIEVGIVQLFLDSAYMLPVSKLSDGIANGLVKRHIERSYNKPVYYTRMSQGMVFGEFITYPTISADLILDRFSKYTPFRHVTGGDLRLSDDAWAILIGC